MSRKDKAVLVAVIIIVTALSALISWAAYQADPGGMGPDAFVYGWPQTFTGSAGGLERWRSSARGQMRSNHRPRNSGANPTSYGREWSRND